MAVVVFSNAAGKVLSFTDPMLPARVTLRIPDWGGFLGFKSIVSRVTVTSRGNFQFLHTLGGQVFVYVFGDRIGQLSISGLSFDEICEDTTDTLGIERVLGYYDSHRIAARSTPVKVSIGTATTLSAYLIGVTGDVVDPKSRIWQYNIEMALIPSDDIDEDIDKDSDKDEDSEGGGVINSLGGLLDDFIGSDYFETLTTGGVSMDKGGVSLAPGLTTGNTSGGLSWPSSGPKLEMIKPVVP